MIRKAFIALLLISVVSGSLMAENAPPPRPEKYFVPFSAPQNFIEHARLFKEETIQVGPYNIWSFNTPNHGFGNSIIIEGDNSLVVIDTTVATEHAQVVVDRLKEMTDKPIEAVIYTHHHADHTNGAAVFISREDAASGKVKVIASENLMRETVQENVATGPIMGLRAGYMYGVMLPGDAEGQQYHVGCCGFNVRGTGGFIPPNTSISLEGETEMSLAGYRFIFFHTGGESASHMGIYMPDQKVLFTGDEIQGPTFPQLHSLRGTRPRDIEKWVGALDKMRGYQADHMVPSHGPTVSGQGEISKILTNYRDAMQYVNDQSVRLINMGFTPDELAETIRLPGTVQVEPWGVEYYGNVDVSVRNVYGGYISWWNGDPAELRPTPRLEKARRTVEIMGGRDKVFAEAEKAFFAGDAQWAAELTTPLIRINREDWQARYLKAAALRVLGYAQTSSSLRGFYLTGALEIEGKIPVRALQDMVLKQIFSIETTETAIILDNLRYSINPKRADGKRSTLGFSFTDTGEKFTLTLRNSVLEITEKLPSEADAMVTMTRKFGNRIFLGEETWQSGIDSGAIEVKGEPGKVTEFFAVMDKREELPDPHISLR